MATLTRILAAAVVLIAMCATEAAAQAGKDDFQHYCAVCHKPDGKGGGTWQGTKVPDLTRLSEDNGGVFPIDAVRKVVDGRSMPRWHQRVRDMPYWGEIFAAEADTPGAKAQVQDRINAIVDYVKGIQGK